jgi:hypothetical protein
MLDGKIDRIGDEASGACVVMERQRLGPIAAARQANLRTQHHAPESSRPVGLLADLALGVIDIGRYHDPRLGAKMEIPKLMTGRERGDHQLFRIPARRVAAKERVGRSEYRRFSAGRK